MRKIFVVLDYLCNSECKSCAKKSEEGGSLSNNQVLEHLDSVNPQKEDYIELSGGEPTIRKDLVALCNEIKSRYDTNLVILSNGRRFENLDFAKEIKESGVNRVMTTFYSSYEETHDALTQRPGSHKESVRGIKNLEDIGLPISVKTVILNQNYKQLPDFVSFAYDTFPSAWVSLHGLVIRGYARDNAEEVVPRYKDINPFVEDALDIAIERKKNLGVFMIPSCTIDPIYWKYLSINWKEMSKRMVYLSPEEAVLGNMEISQPDYCNGCLIGANCSWAWESGWKEYIDLFGTEELNKITRDKVRWK